MEEPQTESATPVPAVDEGILKMGTMIQVHGLPFVINGDVRVLGNVSNLLAVGIPPAPVDTDLTCFEKARSKGEPTFTLRAQDITAPVLVRAWAMVQVHVGLAVAQGFTPDEAVRRMEDLLGAALALPDDVDATNPKIEIAIVRSLDMQQWPNRRLAD